jgi:MoxR-like ATPase
VLKFHIFVYNVYIMEENWKQVEESVNQKEVDIRSSISSTPTVDLPPELQAYITETITNDIELSSEESALADLRIQNVKASARAFHVFDKKLAKLKEDRRRFEERFLITSAKNRPPQIIEAMKKINTEIEDIEKSIDDLMQSNPEAYIVRNALELRNYRKQLRFEGFVLTPYAEKKLEELQDNYYAVDKIPFLNGETGSGKSSVAKYFVEEVLGTEPERIAGAKGIDETKIFGKIDLTSDEKGPQALFVRGPLYRAMEKGVPLIIEEVNAIPPEILKSLNDIIINAKKGEEVAVIGDPKGSKISAKAGFGVIMTGNLNRNPKAIDRYKGLFELSADFVNRIRPIDYDYLPQSTEGNYKEGAGKENELYTLMIAMVMNDKGDVNAPEEAFDDLWRLAKFTRKIQEVYSGQRDGKLFSGQAGLNVPVTATSSVISMRDVKQVIESWKRDNFEKEFDYYIYKELIAPLTNVMDIKFFVQQLQAEGFFANDSWKAVISKAGTFDSAIHAPENKGKDL